MSSKDSRIFQKSDRDVWEARPSRLAGKGSLYHPIAAYPPRGTSSSTRVTRRHYKDILRGLRHNSTIAMTITHATIVAEVLAEILTQDSILSDLCKEIDDPEVSVWSNLRSLSASDWETGRNSIL